MPPRISLLVGALLALILALSSSPGLADPCSACGGSGRCRACGGQGYTPGPTLHGQPSAYGCPSCGGVRGDPNVGTGRPGNGRCRTCGGTGQVGGGGSATGQTPTVDDSAERARAAAALEAQRQRARDEERRLAEEAAKRAAEAFARAQREAIAALKGLDQEAGAYKGAGQGLGLKGLDDGPGLGLKSLDEPLFTSKLVTGVDFSGVQVQEGVPNPAQLRQELLGNLPGAIGARTAQPNDQVREIMRSIGRIDVPSPIKNISKLAAGDVILVAPVPVKDLKQAGLWDVGVSNGINLLDRWGSGNWSSPASHTAVFLGERNGKRWYLDNTLSKGPVIMEEGAFLKEYGARKMDVATLVGQPLSRHEGEELWRGAHELRNTVRYGPSQFANWGRDYGMVCSESSRWLLLRAGRRVPEVPRGNATVAGVDTGLNERRVVTFSPADFYGNEQYFVIHGLSLERQEGSRP